MENKMYLIHFYYIFLLANIILGHLIPKAQV